MNYKSILSLIAGLMIVGNVKAQSSVDIKFWSLLSLKFEKGFQDLTNKYDGYESSSILFNKDFVKINVFKSASCAPGMMCTQENRAPDTVIKLQVRKIVRSECYDSYYASTADNIKTSLYEQVIVNRFRGHAKKECVSLLGLRDGYIHFKATGLSKSTGEEVSAHGYATLVDVKIVSETSIPAPTIPKE